MKTFNKIYPYGVIPVIAIDDSRHAVPLAKAFARAGLPVMEITFRTEAAEESIRRIAQEAPEVILGAGTILQVEQAQRAIEAGAQFLVTPGLNPKVVSYSQEHQVDVVPGVSTPTEVEQAIGLGLNTLKFFPAEVSGGAAAVKALGGPYREISFIPTGGIDERRISEYSRLGNVLACGASYLADRRLIAEERFDEIEARARAAVKAVHNFTVAHVGINGGSEEEAKGVAQAFCSLFGFTKEEGRISCFASKEIEVMYDDTYGVNGHLSITANSIDRALRYLQRQGVELRKDTIKYNEQGKMRFAYLKNQIGGFAIHLY
ncbi:MAG: bifunctional 4-hydroxy-2-oxoglutarate aldolase/2-dehydro-3-deoxy-phosphogluconate aldolase [Lachnospiraceae bacterium]|nr:bifunctional 4-hydroxy-2-oxoglutarate aldolase/2-dehydro-3-deoxy-phosphogluconate aldolase [Lachnospiraceae bacterium]